MNQHGHSGSEDSQPDVVHYSLNACRNCRRLHKKCSKRLPSCELCTKYNKTCDYQSIGKRGPKTTSEYSQPYPQITFHKVVGNSTANSSVQTPQPNTDDPILSMAAESLRLPAIIPNKRLINAGRYVEAESQGRKHSGTTPETEDVGLVYSLHSTMFMMRQKTDKAKYYYHKAKELIMSQFDRVFHSEVVLASYLFLGLHCVLANDFDGAIFFLDTVKSVLDRRATSPSRGTTYLTQTYNFVVALIQGDMNLHQMIKMMIMNHVTSVEQFKNGEDSVAMAEIINYSLLDYTELDIQLIKNDLLLQTNSYDLTSDRIAKLSFRFATIYDKLTNMLPKEIIETQKFQSKVILQGAQLQRYVDNGELEMAKPIADYIARLTTYPVFKTTYVMISVVVMLAAKAHMLYLQTTRDYNERSAVIESLHLEWNALSFVLSSNKLIGERCRPIMDIIVQVLNRVQENSVLRNIYYEPPPQPQVYQFENSFTTLLSTPEFSPAELVLPNYHVGNHHPTIVPTSDGQVLTLTDDVAIFDALDKFFSEISEGSETLTLM